MLEHDKTAQTWASLTHLSGLLFLVPGLLGMPFLSWLGPLLVWLMKRHTHAFIDDQGKEAINFHLTLGLLLFIPWALFMIPLVGWLFYPIYLLVLIWGIVFNIVAAIRSSNGFTHLYPLNLRLVK